MRVLACFCPLSSWIQIPNGCRVAPVNCALVSLALLLSLSPIAASQTSSQASNNSTWKYSRHKVSCLCGRVQVCSGDICGRPSDYGLDDDITVELRDKSGTTIDTQKVVVETSEMQGTRQDGTKVSIKLKERKFCFEGKRDGNYQFAFVLHKNGVSQPAEVFFANYSHKRNKPCDSDYMVEP